MDDLETFELIGSGDVSYSLSWFEMLFGVTSSKYHL